MTSESDTYPLQADLNPHSPDGHGRHAGSPDDSCIARWEDEGGLHMEPELQKIDSPLQSHLSKTNILLKQGRIDCAVKELTSAAERLKNYQSMVSISMNETIKQLSSIGCHATAPHPKALHLVRLRQQM